MKKNIGIFMVIIIIAIVFVTSLNSNAIQSPNPTTVPVYFHISGCDNCNITYCITNITQNYNYRGSSNSCDFILYLEPADYSICVNCNNSKIGYASFTVNNDVSKYITVKIGVSPGGTCPCDITKKK